MLILRSFDAKIEIAIKSRLIAQPYLEHVGSLEAPLGHVLGLGEQVVQQARLVQLPHQLALQAVLHVVHQEVHHRLGDTGEGEGGGRGQGRPASPLAVRVTWLGRFDHVLYTRDANEQVKGSGVFAQGSVQQSADIGVGAQEL